MKTLLLISAALLCGCASSDILRPMPNDISGYRYYVIDANSDIPDANFTSFEEAAVYQKEYQAALILKDIVARSKHPF